MIFTSYTVSRVIHQREEADEQRHTPYPIAIGSVYCLVVTYLDILLQQPMLIPIESLLNITSRRYKARNARIGTSRHRTASLDSSQTTKIEQSLMTRRVTPPTIVRHHKHDVCPLLHKTSKTLTIQTFIADCRTKFYTLLFKYSSLIVTT